MTAAFLTGAFVAGAFLARSLLGTAAFLTAGAFLATAAFLAAGLLDAAAAFLTAAFLAGAFLATAFLAAPSSPRPPTTPRLTAGPSDGRRCAPDDNRLELRAGTERGHGSRLHLHGLAGARIARNASGALALLENAEAGDGDAVALVHGAHDGVDDVLDGGGGLPTIRAQLLREYVDELCFVHAKPPKPVVLLGPTRGHGKPCKR